MRFGTVCLVLVLVAGLATAGDIDDAGFGLRLSAAISRYPRYADIAGLGGASAGSRYSSAVNPAGCAFRPAVGDGGWGASVQYAGLIMEEGTRVHTASLSAAVESDVGVWQPAVLGLRSNEEETSDGLTFEWEAVSAEIQWAILLDEKTSVGVNLNYLQSDMDFSLDSIRVTEATSQTFGIRVGFLREISETFYLGLALDYSAAPATTRTYDFMGIGVGAQSDDDTTRQVLFRPGIYFFLTDDLTAYVDYQFGWFDDDTGTLRVHRFYAGFDQTIVEGVYARLGTVLDTEGNASFAFGLGLAPSESIYLDAAYQVDMFPELDEEFGRGDLISIGLTVLF